MERVTVIETLMQFREQSHYNRVYSYHALTMSIDDIIVDDTGMVKSIPHSWIKKWNVYWRNPVWVGSYKTLQHNHLHYGHFNLLMFLVLYLFPIILLNNRSINYHKVSTSERMQYSSTLIQNEGGFTRSDPTMNAGHFKGWCDDLAIHATQL